MGLGPGDEIAADFADRVERGLAGLVLRELAGEGTSLRSPEREAGHVSLPNDCVVTLCEHATGQPPVVCFHPSAGQLQIYQPLVEALYSDQTSVYIETEVSFEDGRKGMIAADLAIIEAETFDQPEPLKQAS